MIFEHFVSTRHRRRDLGPLPGLQLHLSDGDHLHLLHQERHHQALQEAAQQSHQRHQSGTHSMNNQKILLVF